MAEHKEKGICLLYLVHIIYYVLYVQRDGLTYTVTTELRERGVPIKGNSKCKGPVVRM